MSSSAIIVMLYGAAHDPSDINYFNYCYGALMLIRTYRNYKIRLVGGATDPSHPDDTEAESVGRIFEERFFVERDKLKITPRGLDAREVLEIHANDISPKSRVVIFCAWTHQDLVRFHARRLFGERATIVPLAFPAGVMNGSAQAWILRLRRVPRTLLGMAGVHLRPVRELELWLRRRHMEAASHRQS